MHMNGKGDLGPEPVPLRVLSQTSVSRTGPTYLKLSTLRPSMPLDQTNRDLPTCKIEFLPRELVQNEMADGTSHTTSSVSSSSKSSHRPQPRSTSSGRRASFSSQSNEGLHVDEHQGHILEDIRENTSSPSSSANQATSSPSSSVHDQRPFSSSSSPISKPGPSKLHHDQKTGPLIYKSKPSSSNARAIQKPDSSNSSNSQQKPSSSNVGNAPFTIHHQTWKVRGIDREMEWYYSFRNPGITSPPPTKYLKEGLDHGYLYLHYLSEEALDLLNPCIWMWEVKSDDVKGWVKIEKGSPCPFDVRGRFLSISSHGKPSWKKKAIKRSTRVSCVSSDDDE